MSCIKEAIIQLKPPLSIGNLFGPSRAIISHERWTPLNVTVSKFQ